MLRRGLLMFAACGLHADEIDRDDWQGWILLRDSNYEYLLIAKEERARLP